MAVEQVENERLRAEKPYSKHRLGLSWTSYEFNSFLLGERDDLAYALMFLEELHVTLSQEVTQRLETADLKLRESLPKMLQQYREARDDPTPRSDRFPQTFWWRRVS